MLVSEPELLIGWCAIAVFVVGFFLAFLRARRWYAARTWDDMVHTVDPIEEYPATRFSLRREK